MRQIRHPAPQSIKDARGAISPRVTLLLGGEIHIGHVSNFTYEDDIKIKNKHVAGIPRTFIYPLKPSAGLHNLVRLSL
jgi:hypothetical protein